MNNIFGFFQVLKERYGSKIQLLYSDTDSLMVCLQSSDIINDLEMIRDTLDTSNFNPNHPLYSPKNASELFYVKMELPAHTILAGVFLKAKAYALLIQPNETQYTHENKKKKCSEYSVRSDNLLQLHRCKGIPAVARKNLLFEHYLSVLMGKKNTHKSVYNKLSSKEHIIHQIKQRKLALTSFEDKRVLLNCSIHTKPYGDSTIHPDFKCLICNE